MQPLLSELRPEPGRPEELRYLGVLADAKRQRNHLAEDVWRLGSVGDDATDPAEPILYAGRSFNRRPTQLSYYPCGKIETNTTIRARSGGVGTRRELGGWR
jgi:hypothetical protein